MAPYNDEPDDAEPETRSRRDSKSRRRHSTRREGESSRDPSQRRSGKESRDPSRRRSTRESSVKQSPESRDTSRLRSRRDSPTKQQVAPEPERGESRRRSRRESPTKQPARERESRDPSRHRSSHQRKGSPVKQAVEAAPERASRDPSRLRSTRERRESPVKPAVEVTPERGGTKEPARHRSTRESPVKPAIEVTPERGGSREPSRHRSTKERRESPKKPAASTPRSRDGGYEPMRPTVRAVGLERERSRKEAVGLERERSRREVAGLERERSRRDGGGRYAAVDVVSADGRRMSDGYARPAAPAVAATAPLVDGGYSGGGGALDQPASPAVATRGFGSWFTRSPAPVVAPLVDGVDDPSEAGDEPERTNTGSKKFRKKSAAAAAASAAAKATPSRRQTYQSTRRKKEKRVSVNSVESGDSGGGRRKGLCCGCGKWFWILLVVTIVLLVIFIPVGVVVSKKGLKSATAATATSAGTPKDGEFGLPAKSTIPAADKGTIYDPYTWADLTDFNLTYTKAMVGGLPIMGLFDKWDDSTQANANVPPLNEAWKYGAMPIRGVNLGGWLIVEPFITPSFFSAYSMSQGIVDEYTLSAKLGVSDAKTKIENHYSTFVTESTFKEIADAGLDHVRLPYGYWAVEVYDDDTFVPKVSWRYLLRAIEWARKYGLRIKLDLHSVPGGANGWNHSGRLGVMNWLTGPNGALNGQRTLDIHARLAEFFSQPRYKNIVTMYGLVNEPKMSAGGLNADTVIKWTEDAYDIVREKGFSGEIIFGDGFRGLSSWKGEFSGRSGMLLDVHQYVLFNIAQIGFTHTRKIDFACNDWAVQVLASMDTSSG